MKNKLTPKKEGIPKFATITSSLAKKKKSKSKHSEGGGGYDSEESEGTQALNMQYDHAPHEFVSLGSHNFKKLPTIDQARIFLLQKSPKVSTGQI